METRRWLQLWLAVILLAGCGGQADGSPGVTVDLDVTPFPPGVGPAVVVVTLTNLAGETLGGAAVEVEGTMTHAGMVPVFVNAVEVAPGIYEAELEFTMGGDWILIVRAALPDGRSLEEQFEVPGVTMPD